MERLTIKDVGLVKDNFILDIGVPFKEAINRLGELEDEIENGTLLEAPCKVGDTVYVINYQWLIYRECEVIAIEFRKSDVFIALRNSLTDCFHIPNSSVWTETVSNNMFKRDWFLTRKEAEKRLEELKG